MFARIAIIAFYALGVALVSIFIQLYCLIDRHLPDSVPTTRTYDYIIVGAGTAGLTILAGLPAGQRVLLLEAGTSHTNALFEIPLITPLLQQPTHPPTNPQHDDSHDAAANGFDWSRYTVPQSHACGAMRGRHSRWPAGRGFGGSQILNYMMWTRGHPDDYRGWFGPAPSYDYERDVAPHFSAAESKLQLSRLPHRSRLADAFVNATLDSGYGGAHVPMVTQSRGRRYTNAQYYREQRQRQPQLRKQHDIVMGAHVQQLLFDDDATVKTATPPTPPTPLSTLMNQKTADMHPPQQQQQQQQHRQPLRVVGVVYERDGHQYRVRAGRGVILSAGTIGTPAILHGSGIGPSEWLNHANASQPHADTSTTTTAASSTSTTASSAAPSTAAHPLAAFRHHLAGVGRNLQDHPTTGVDLVLLRESPGAIQPWQLLTPRSLWDYARNGDGPLTMCGCEALGFVNTTSAGGFGDADDGQPNIGFMVMPLGASTDGGAHFRHVLNLKTSVWTRYFAPLTGQPAVSILPVVLHPHSRGEVKLVPVGRERSPSAAAVGRVEIDPKYLHDERDVEALVLGIRVLQQLLERPSLKRRLGAELNPQVFPGCEQEEFGTKAYWRCYVRELTLTAFHPVGTCRMGEAEDEGAVVGRDYRVHGVGGLWVVDASVMPSLPSGNPNAAVAMLAERFVAMERKRLGV